MSFLLCLAFINISHKKSSNPQWNKPSLIFQLLEYERLSVLQGRVSLLHRAGKLGLLSSNFCLDPIDEMRGQLCISNVLLTKFICTPVIVTFVGQRPNKSGEKLCKPMMTLKILKINWQLYKLCPCGLPCRKDIQIVLHSADWRYIL